MILPQPPDRDAVVFELSTSHLKKNRLHILYAA
jgi:hypothetical protein